MISRPWSWYSEYHMFRYGIVRSQLMQLYVQKSTRMTSLPIRLPIVMLSTFTNPEGSAISFAYG